MLIKMRIIIFYNLLLISGMTSCKSKPNHKSLMKKNQRDVKIKNNDQLTNALEKLFNEATTTLYNQNKDLFSVNNPRLMDQWYIFKEINNKTYEDDEARLKIFLNNTKNIMEHNKQYYKKKVGYKMGVNRFADLTSEEFGQLIGCTRLVRHESHSRYYMHHLPMYHFKDVIKSVGKVIYRVPQYRNWKTEIPDVVRPARDQQDCAACYAFAAVAILEGHLKIHKKTYAELSPQNLVDCQTVYMDCGCKGGRILNSLAYIKAYGILSEEDYPYTAKDGKCEFNKKKIVTRIIGAVSITGNETELKIALNYGPVASSLNGRAVQFYRSGTFYETDCPKDVTHIVNVVGYGSDNEGADYWEIQNSWGRDWGDEGFMKIVRNRDNHCAIGLDATYPLIK